MLIDVPVTILFDCQDRRRDSSTGAAFERVFTLRYDTEDDNVPAKYCLGYPPGKRATWYEDTGDALFSLMPDVGFRKLKERAARYPADYHADAEEGERLQAEIDAAREADGAFGGGAD